MTFAELALNPAFPRALVLGALGGIGLVLTMTYSRRGPLIYPVYAALLASLTLLLARYGHLSFGVRAVDGFAGFFFASILLYVAVGFHARRQRARLIAEGRLPATSLRSSVSFLGHTWRLGFLAVVGSVLSAAIAFISA